MMSSTSDPGARLASSPYPAVGLHTEARTRWRDLPRLQRLRMAGWVVWAVVLTLLFFRTLTRLMVHAAQSELHSYIVLVPLIVSYLLLTEQRTRLAAYRSSIGGTMIVGGIGLAALAAGIEMQETLSLNDHLALMALAFVSLVAAGGFLFMGLNWMAAAAFPMTFLLFMIPLPDAAVDWLETASQVASADVAVWLFNLTGTPLFRQGMFLTLPTIVLEVAQECSGIRSSLVLVITSLLASHVFLKSPWRRIVLVAFVIPLGIVRNGFRILIIGLLCVRVGPHMIDSTIHRRGGPVFFVLSLGPLFLWLWWLRRRERQMNLRE
jgi:exosortase C (VPDSG-CTERM-specific)